MNDQARMTQEEWIQEQLGGARAIAYAVLGGVAVLVIVYIVVVLAISILERQA